MADLSLTARNPSQDFIRATPRNPVLGFLSDIVGSSYSPQRTQQMQGMANFFGAPAISQTLDRISFGEPLTTGAGGLGGTTRIRPEALEAGMTVAPFMGLTARLTKGLPVGMGIKDVGKLDALTGLPLNTDGTVTLFHHTNKSAAEQIAKTGMLKSAGESSVYLTTRKMTDTGYGDVAVPVKVKPSLLNLDDEFPNGRLDFSIDTGKPKGSISVTIDKQAPQAPQAEALRLAQQRAALPLEQGGLGLPAGNTAMDRAKAMGFDVDAYHGSDSDILTLDKALLGQNTNAPSAKKAFFSAGNPRTTYAYLDEGFTGTDATMISEYGKTFSQIDNQLREISKKTGQSITDLRNNFFDGPSPTQLRLDEINKTLAPLTQSRQVGLRRIMPPPLDEKQQILVNKLTNEKEEILAMRQVASTRSMSAGDAIDDTVAYIPPDYKNAGANIMPLRLNVKNAKEYDDMGRGYRADSYSNRIDDALSQGFDSAIIRNTRDGYQPLDDIYAITNPDNIRSRFAAFDPFRRNAAIAAAMGVAAPNLLAAEQTSGPKKTWDAYAAQKAKMLEDMGRDPKSIWQETGTWRGTDGQLRQEIMP